MGTCCRILGIEYQCKAQQIGSAAVESDRGDPIKNIREIRELLEKLVTKLEEHRKTSPGPSLITRNTDGLEAPT
jgi:hypothetical protein